MGTNYLATSRVVRNPVRVQQWNATLRAGDDFKLALTVYSDDLGTPAQVASSVSQILLWPDQQGYPHSCDYGLAWATGGSPIPGPAGGVRQIAGFTTPVRPGGINFSLAAADTLAFSGRYHLAIQIELPDGAYSEVEGILQIRNSWRLAGFTLPDTAYNYFTLDSSDLDGPTLLAPLVVNGIPVDVDGFPLIAADTSQGAIAPAPQVTALTVASLTTLLAALPTTLPGAPGVLWNDGGVLAIS
jgi:hypothetical protein